MKTINYDVHFIRFLKKKLVELGQILTLDEQIEAQEKTIKFQERFPPAVYRQVRIQQAKNKIKRLKKERAKLFDAYKLSKKRARNRKLRGQKDELSFLWDQLY